MFEELIRRPSAIARHRNAPYAEERTRYLSDCAQRGESRATLQVKAYELFWIAHKLSVYPDLHLTIEQVETVACGWSAREQARGYKLHDRWTRQRFIAMARRWLRFLNCLQEPPTPPIPFQSQFNQFREWTRHERGLTDQSIASYDVYVVPFLRWYGFLQRLLSDVRAPDIDAYLAFQSGRGWDRVTIRNAALRLKGFFRYAGTEGWCDKHLHETIHGPRLYAKEGLPAGPAWSDVQRILAAVDTQSLAGLSDRAILMLFAIYGLRVSEVAWLRLDDIDWEHDRLRITRAKRRTAQVYPLLPSVGNALLEYLKVRRPSPYPQVFLKLMAPYQPLSRGGLYHVVNDRMKALGILTAHRGPHALRHACATRLAAEGLPFKEIGDHLGHRSVRSTAIYAKVDLPSLRTVAAFDLGELP